MKRLTAEWVRKAESDYQLAVQIVDGSQPFHDQVCFLCQQSAEKYLKALLKEAGANVPRTHNLLALLSLVTPHHRLGGLLRGLKFLTDFAVDMRYPPVRATKRQATAALRWAAKIREACRPLLGIPPPRRAK
jgi:HEPN domain-containing protein